MLSEKSDAELWLWRQRASEHAKKLDPNSEDGAGVGAVIVLLFLCFAFSPFLVVGVLSGRYFYQAFEASGWTAIGIGAAVSLALVILVRRIHRKAIDLKFCDNMWFIPLRLIIVAAVAGFPFYLGATFSLELLGDEYSKLAQAGAALLGGSLYGAISYKSVLASYN